MVRAGDQAVMVRSRLWAWTERRRIHISFDLTSQVIRTEHVQRMTDEERSWEAPMGATENAKRIREGYDAFNRADVAALVDLFAEDFVWHFPGASKLAGEHLGR